MSALMRFCILAHGARHGHHFVVGLLARKRRPIEGTPAGSSTWKTMTSVPR
jgi:hypothetical protein